MASGAVGTTFAPFASRLVMLAQTFPLPVLFGAVVRCRWWQPAPLRLVSWLPWPSP